VRQVKEELNQAGLGIEACFDLRSALAGSIECPCPHHGTADCDCQMVVLLVYGPGEPPLTLTAHGHNYTTWISLEESPRLPVSPDLAGRLELTLGDLAYGQRGRAGAPPP
jgi:hypothetical protein